MSGPSRRAGPATGPASPSPALFAVTFCGLLAVGAVLPVLPRYVHGPLGSGDLAVGVVIGAYAITGLLLRPVAGRLADRRGRKPTVLVGALLLGLSGLLYLPRLGIAGLIVARLVLGAGEGSVYTAGSAWIVDLAPPARRGRVLGLYGLAVWGGLSVGPAGRRAAAADAAGYTAVWIFAAVAAAARRADRLARPGPLRARVAHAEPHPLIAREAVGPGSRSPSPRSATRPSPPSSSSTSKPAGSATAPSSSAPSRR